MKDEIVIAKALDDKVRIHAAYTKGLVEAARKAHDCAPTSAAALGRTLTVTAIMASDLKKEDEKIVSIINGHGPAGTILAQAMGNGDVRGFIGDPGIYLSREDGHLDVGRAVGTNGTLTVTKDLGLKEPFTGVVALQSGEIGEDFTYYFAISEQTPSVVSVGVLVDVDWSVLTAGGLIFQLLPGADEACIKECERIAASMRSMTSLLKEGNSSEEIIKMYFPDAEILERRDVRWHCGCSRERFSSALGTLKDSDLEEMIADGKGAEIRCQYCNTLYQFSTDELKDILQAKHVLHR